ncbi:MAG: TetR/AcrR family transcriptional regulator [Solirubrobacterales bacterium]|nr:TetR/AcrR family transcriptional regulator [Solirubrobacterales bacterium]
MSTTVRELRKAETREALLAAGRAVFVREGYHRASLDRVAKEAGFTKGAVYAHFPTKADLLLAIYEERSAVRAARIRQDAATVATVDALRRQMVDGWTAVLRDERDWSLLLIEFWVHVARDDDLRERFAAAHGEIRRAMADVVRQVAEREGRPLPMDPDAFACASQALGNGLNLEAFLGRDDVPALFDAASAMLFPHEEAP